VPTFDEVADELYGLPPEEFTAARTCFEKAAKQCGERELAAAIKALAKPNLAGWLANQLVREHRDELAPLLELGADMRAATQRLAGDQLRELTRQRHELVRALVQQARQLARERGRTVGDDAARGLEDTLHAALVDEGAAAELLTGRLTGPLHRSGLGENEEPAAVLDLTAARQRKKAGQAEQLARAERDLADADQELAAVEGDRDKAAKAVADAEAAAEAAREAVEQSRRQLEQATSAATAADRRRKEKLAALDKAERGLGAARRFRAEAQDRLDRLH
jgi:hypothetical protein